MVLNDTLANGLSKLYQYDKTGKQECTLSPSSEMIENVLKLFKQHNYIKDFKKIQEGNITTILVFLSGNINKCGVIKPRYAVKRDQYEKFEKRYLPSKDMGIIVVSTVGGILSHDKAKDKKLGGKLIAYCY